MHYDQKIQAFQEKREQLWLDVFFATLAMKTPGITGDPAVYQKAVANSALEGFDAAFPEYAPKKDETAND